MRFKGKQIVYVAFLLCSVSYFIGIGFRVRNKLSGNFWEKIQQFAEITQEQLSWFIYGSFFLALNGWIIYHFLKKYEISKGFRNLWIITGSISLIIIVVKFILTGELQL